MALALQCAVALAYLSSPGTGFVLQQGFAISGAQSRQSAKPDIVCRTEHDTRSTKSALLMSSSLDSSTAAAEYKVWEKGGGWDLPSLESTGVLVVGCISVLGEWVNLVMFMFLEFNMTPTPAWLRKRGGLLSSGLVNVIRMRNVRRISADSNKTDIPIVSYGVYHVSTAAVRASCLVCDGVLLLLLLL